MRRHDHTGTPKGERRLLWAYWLLSGYGLRASRATGWLLADAGAEGGEQEAASALFAGAMGAYKNPASHRTVDFDDPIEAAETIQFAVLLLRQVERATRRQGEVGV